MKIAIDIHSLSSVNWAGKEKYVFNFLRELFDIDQENEYVLYCNKELNISLPVNYAYKVIKGRSLFWHLRVLGDLRKERPDIYLATTSYIVPAVNKISKNIIIVYDLVSFIPSINKKHNLKAKLIEKLFLKLACNNSKKIIAISKITKSDLIKFFDVDKEKIKIAYPSASFIKKLNQEFDSQREIKIKYNLPKDFLLFVGTLEPRKNISRLIDAYSKVISEEKFKNCKLIIIGKRGWYYEDIFSQVKNLGIQENIYFLGYIPDEEISSFYKLASVFVYPSYYEGFGIPVLEAMSCGCPVITSNISSLPEVACDSAILVDPNNTTEIKEAIKELLINQKLREKLIQRGISRAKNFSWRKTANIISICLK